MATAIVHSAVPRQALTPPPDEPQLSLETSHSRSVPIPNKHLPFCPPGPAVPRHDDPSTPPDTPPSKESSLSSFSVLHPPRIQLRIIGQPLVYSIDASTLQAAIEEIASKPLTDPKHTFPWLHGLHDRNQVQLSFFNARRGIQKDTPGCLRGITLIKAGGDLSHARLKGAISPDEILTFGTGEDASFLDVDPKEGFCIRNFHIQVAKVATVSDIIVYRDSSISMEELYDLAKKISTAQNAVHMDRNPSEDPITRRYSTFVLAGWSGKL